VTRSLRDLLSTWENWSARQTLLDALRRATTDTQRRVLLDAIEQKRRWTRSTPSATPPNSSPCSEWRWQAVYAERARTDYLEAIDRQERYAIGYVAAYRAAP
jgi:hypothetical protein